MLTINQAQLQHMLETHKQGVVLMAGDEYAYRQAHIPGSILIESPEHLKKIDPRAEIVVYCTNPVCYSSYTLYHYLLSKGYRNVRRYAGGLEEWAAAGLPLEGTLIH